MQIKDLPPRIRGKIVNKDGCWIWTAAKDRNGYGRVMRDRGIGGVAFAHRLVYELLIDTPGPELDHLCRNRDCVNPQHLESVTHKENCKRGEVGKYQKIKWSKPRDCHRGHQMAGANLYIHYNTRLKRINRQCKKCKLENKRRLRSLGATY